MNFLWMRLQAETYWNSIYIYFLPFLVLATNVDSIKRWSPLKKTQILSRRWVLSIFKDISNPPCSDENNIRGHSFTNTVAARIRLHVARVSLPITFSIFTGVWGGTFPWLRLSLNHSVSSYFLCETKFSPGKMECRRSLKVRLWQWVILTAITLIVEVSSR